MTMRLFALLPLVALLALGAEEGGHAEPSVTYKWINFGILAAGLLYLIAKFLVPALSARSSAIEKDLLESKSTVRDAEAKVASLTAKLGNFDGEIRGIREKAKAEQAVEGERIAAQTESLLTGVKAHRETEIGNLSQVAQSQLRQFTVDKALEIAHARLAAQTDPATQGALVNAFLGDLKKQGAQS